MELANTADRKKLLPLFTWLVLMPRSAEVSFQFQEVLFEQVETA